MNLDYWIKSDKAIDENIFWNVPEQRTGILQIIGGNSNNFSTEIKQTEFLNTLNLKEVRLLLPDSLRTKIPPVPGINFAPSTESGSFDKSSELKFAINDADITLLSGDFSKNSITSVALTSAIKESTKPIIIARDTIDVVSESAEEFIEKGNITIVATMSQLQKLFRNLMYPKMILLSSPLMPIVELVGVFTKPIVLMIRLFANMTAGHIVILGFVVIIFIISNTISMGVGAGVSVISVVFSVFISVLECLVAYIQAFVFTMLSALYIGMAVHEPHHVEA